jgi:hypothetical protein
VPCLYLFYVETFFAAGAALRRNDEEWLASINAAAEMLDEKPAWAAKLAVNDAARGASLRARGHLCEAFVSEACTGGRCPQAPGAVRPGHSLRLCTTGSR